MEMKLGAVYPQNELGGAADAVVEVGAACEELGLDYLLAYDHVLGAEHEGRELWGPYTERDPFHDPFVLFAFLAGRTTRLEFATGILILPQRQTALVAKQAADLQVLSGGRFRLGVGAGWNWVEYEALGQDFATRGGRLDEQIPLVRRYLSEPLLSFEGRFDRVERAGIAPLPRQPVPVWVGGFSAPAFRRGARLGDGFIFSGAGRHAAEGLAVLRAELAAVGRSEEPFGLEAIVSSRKGPQAVADAVRRWQDMGGTHASISSLNLGLDSAAAHVDYLAKVVELVRG